MRKKKFFFVFFSDFFRILSEIFFRLSPTNLQKVVKTTSSCPQEQLVALYLFKKFWTVLDFLQKPLAWFLKFYLRVQSKKCGKKSLFLFSFQNFFRILSENFSDFWPKNFKRMWKLPSACPEEQFVAWNFFLKVLNRFGFSAETFGMVLKSLSTCPEWKLRKKTVSLFFFSEFFRILSEEFFRLSAKKLQENAITTFCVSRGTTCSLNFSKKIWIVSDFLQKPLAWFSKVYLRVQSKNCGKNIFFCFLFRFFFDFWAKDSQTFGKKNFQKMWKLLLRVHINNLWLNNFLKCFEPLWIFYRNLWHGSQNSIYVSRVKIAGKMVCFFFFSEFFSNFERKFFRLLAKKFQEVFKTTFYVSRGTVFGFNFFLKFWIVLDFLQKPSVWFSKFYLRVQCKNCGKNSFFVFFSELFRILSETFSDFWPKNFKKMWKLSSACPQEQLVAV